MSRININIFNQLNSYTKKVNQIEREYSNLDIDKSLKGTGYIGTIMPIFKREMPPKTKINLKQLIGIQMTPWVTQCFEEFHCNISHYFVPYRLLTEKEEDWNNFIMGGITGLYDSTMPALDLKKYQTEATDKQKLLHTPLDYLEFPILQEIGEKQIKEPRKPCVFALRAYNKIYNDHLRPIDFQQEEVPLDDNKLHKALYLKDYFTSSKRWQIRGMIPQVPMSGELKHYIETSLETWNNNRWAKNTITSDTYSMDNLKYGGQKVVSEGTMRKGVTLVQAGGYGPASMFEGSTIEQTMLPHKLEGIGLNVFDLISAMAISSVLMTMGNIRYMYNDYLQAFWGCEDQQLLTGMAKFIKSETFKITSDGIVQTSYGDVGAGQTPQGNITSQASGTNQADVYFEANEWGIFMSMLTITPTSSYTQGLPRLLSCRTPFEMMQPLLVNLPRRAIENGEIFYTGKDTDLETFGWTEQYDEYRIDTNGICGLMRPDAEQGLGIKTLARNFTECPVLNTEFLQVENNMDRIKVYTTAPDFEFILANNYGMIQPIPFQPDPQSLINL